MHKNIKNIYYAFILLECLESIFLTFYKLTLSKTVIGFFKNYKYICIISLLRNINSYLVEDSLLYITFILLCSNVNKSNSFILMKLLSIFYIYMYIFKK